MSSKKGSIHEIRVISGKSILSFSLFLFITLTTPLNSFDIYNSSLQEEEIIDLISYNKDNPLNLNTVSFDQLVKIPYIDFSTAERIIQRVEIKGNFDNTNQLKYEKIIEDDIYDLISDCFYISIKSSIKEEPQKFIDKKQQTFFKENTKINYSSRFKRRLQKSRAYKESIYLGSDNYMSNKITFRTEDIKFSFISKKDAGEIGNTNNMKYSLSYSFYKKNSFILGYFKLNSPSRLSWDETSFRDDFIIQNRTNTNGISKKYISSGISSMDSYGLKGGAISYELANNSIFKQQIEIYYGIKDITVNFSDEIQDDKKIKTVITTGFNRTINEMERYNNAEYSNQGFVYQIGDSRNKKYFLATSLYYQKYNYEFIDTIDERKYNNSFVGDVSGEYSFADKKNKVNFNFTGNNNSSYSYNLVASHNFGNTTKRGRSLSSIHLKFQDQNINKFNPFSVSNMLNSSYEKDATERSFSLLFKGRSSDRKIYFEIQNDFYLGTAVIATKEENLTGNKFKVQVETDLDKNNNLKFQVSLKEEEQFSNTERKYIDNYEKKYEIKHKFKYDYGNKKAKSQQNSFSLMSLLQYKDEFDGFGYLISENITFSIIPNKSNLFNFIKNSKYKFRIGADSYYTKGNTLIYKNYFTTGLYTALNSYSGKGISIYFITSYSFLKYYKITIGINENYKSYNDTFGSGYDEIDSRKVNTFEISFVYKY